MIISDKCKFIFFHIPKTSGTYFTEMLQKHYGDCTVLERVDKATGIDRMHLYYDSDEEVDIYSYIDKAKVDSYFKFCVVRNPYDKIYSAWNNLKRRYPFKNTNEFVENTLSKEWIYGKELIPGDCRVHYRPQHTFIYANEGQNMDFICRYENIEEDVNTMISRHPDIFQNGLDIKYKKKSREFPLYIKYYNQKSIAKINQLYRNDFKKIGYNRIKPIA